MFCPDAVAALAAALRTGRRTIGVELCSCLVVYGWVRLIPEFVAVSDRKLQGFRKAKGRWR